MKYYLVTESGNYADEFDIEGFALFKAESEQALKDNLWKSISSNHEVEERENDYEEDDKHLAWPMEFYFGTNEAITYNSKEEIFQELVISEITKSQYNIIKDLLGTRFSTSALL